MRSSSRKGYGTKPTFMLIVYTHNSILSIFKWKLYFSPTFFESGFDTNSSALFAQYLFTDKFDKPFDSRRVGM